MKRIIDYIRDVFWKLLVQTYTDDITHHLRIVRTEENTHDNVAYRPGDL